ncbi:cuticle protein 10.9-like [Tropilaelaps mercedesae]|uniref:Cuticle protein 10.9-like n=1 Tax=Tropilaelaps mercedesae TaxID=418985 RepID=A0A1V9XJI3_9ACAR|nr:cuticle protein 10.9-like [Tropilaelaps mercedesae]
MRIMIAFVSVAVFFSTIVSGQRARLEENYGPPQPFEFSYSSQDPEGTHSHNQQGDANGRVTGEYTLQLADGRSRTVRYTADENGYRAEIITNELGTESKNPADVIIQSSAPTGAEAAIGSPSSPAAPRPIRPAPRRQG